MKDQADIKLICINIIFRNFSEKAWHLSTATHDFWISKNNVFDFNGKIIKDFGIYMGLRKQVYIKKWIAINNKLI